MYFDLVSHFFHDYLSSYMRWANQQVGQKRENSKKHYQTQRQNVSPEWSWNSQSLDLVSDGLSLGHCTPQTK